MRREKIIIMWILKIVKFNHDIWEHLVKNIMNLWYLINKWREYCLESLTYFFFKNLLDDNIGYIVVVGDVILLSNFNNPYISEYITSILFRSRQIILLNLLCKYYNNSILLLLEPFKSKVILHLDGLWLHSSAITNTIINFSGN